MMNEMNIARDRLLQDRNRIDSGDIRIEDLLKSEAIRKILSKEIQDKINTISDFISKY